VVLVTSRTLIMTQAAIPRGCTMLRIEPFDEPRIEAWVSAWNRAACGAAGPGAPMLDVSNALRFPDLAEQPLLLLLLALYNAGPDRAWEGKSGDALEIHGLYEGLLRQFAYREVRRHAGPEGRDEARIKQLIEAELDVLAIVAFSMFNRGAQSILLTALDRDLDALHPDSGPSTGSQWSDGERVVGRFFFIHEAEARTSGGAVLRSYEFLHATFGEYLVARRIVREVRRIVALRRADEMRHGDHDGLLYTLLSFAPLTSRGQVITFLTDVLREMPEAERADVSSLLLDLFRKALESRSGRRYDGYRPVSANTPSRHAVYQLNILVILLALEGSVPVARLFGEPEILWARDALSSAARLWRACLDGLVWTGVVDCIESVDDCIKIAAPSVTNYEYIVRESGLLQHWADEMRTILVDVLRPLANLFLVGSVVESIVALHMRTGLGGKSENELLSALVSRAEILSSTRPELLKHLTSLVAEDPTRFSEDIIARLISVVTAHLGQLADLDPLDVFRIAVSLLASPHFAADAMKIVAPVLTATVAAIFSLGPTSKILRMLAIAIESGLVFKPDYADFDTLLDGVSENDGQTIRDAIFVALEYGRWEWMYRRGLHLVDAAPREVSILITSQMRELIRHGLHEYAATEARDGADVIDRLQESLDRWQEDDFRLILYPRLSGIDVDGLTP
jgi:hypothetical protein